MRVVIVTTVVVLAVLGGLLAATAHADDAVAPAAAVPSDAAVSRDAGPPIRPVLGIVGDSFAAGTPIGGAGGQGFPRMIADRIGWEWRTTAVSGTGYVAHPPGTLPYDAGQIDRMVALHPTVLVIEGSQNDRFADVREVGAAATALYARVRAALPTTRVVVVGPVASNSAQAAGMAALDASVGAAARAAGLPYVDAMAEGWFTDAQAPLIGVDHIHPTWAGHERIADLLGADLARLGVLPPART
jgi:acyl-CoA thioesterase I